MNAAAAPAATWRSVLREEWTHWLPLALFAAKTVAAALLALWLAFRLDLSSPASAMITVFIVAQPTSGMVLEKSLYRLLGTVVGSAVTLALIAAFPQQRVLFTTAMALWIGACTAGATWFRNFRAYAFVLAGYTATLVGFAGILHPEAALQIAVDRVSVVGLGILCAGFITDGLFPQRLSAQLVALVRGRSFDLYRQIERSLLQPPTTAETAARQAALIASVAAFESSRSAAAFESSRSAAAVEDPEARARGARLQRLNAQFMAIASTLYALERWRQPTTRRGDADQAITGQAAIEAALALATQILSRALRLDDRDPPRIALQALALLPQLRAARSTLPATLRTARTTLADNLLPDFDSAAALLRQLAGELVAYTETYAALYRTRDVNPQPAPRFHASVDPRLALINGLRTALVLLATTTFWILTAWPDAIAAIVNATVFSALLASAPDPVVPFRRLLRGFVWGFVAAPACALWLLPQVNGFIMLALVLTPFLLPGIVWLASPGSAGTGTGYLLMFTVAVAPANVMAFDPAHLLNNGIATFAGLSAALLAFTVLLPGTGLRSHARWLQRLRGALAETCRLPLRGLRHRFESLTRDLLQQKQPADAAQIDATLRVLEAGHALLSLRRALPGADPVVRELAKHGLMQLADWLEAPEGHDLGRALSDLRLALERQMSFDAAPDRLANALHRLRSVLLAGDLAPAIGACASHLHSGAAADAA